MPRPDYSMFSLNSKPRTSQTAVPVNTQLERRPPTVWDLFRRDSQDVRPRHGQRESRILHGNRELSDTPQDIIATSTATASTTNDDRFGLSSHPEALPGSDLSDPLRPANAKVPLGHLPQNEQQEMSEIRQPAQGPPPPKDKYHLLQDDYRRIQRELELAYSDLEAHKRDYEHELQRTHRELHNVNDAINELRHEKQLLNKHNGTLQNELNRVYSELHETKALSEVRGKEIFSLTKADELSISEVGEKVTALNEEIFQAAATLGEALIRQRSGLSQEDLDAAIADSRGMVGQKITNLLISQAQKTEPEVDSLLVQVVLQIFMVTFCVSKIQSWYPSDSTIGEFLDAIHTTIRSSEGQGVSGRWRALTRAHTRPSTETWTDELSRKLMAVFKIAAWMPISPENQEYFENWCLPPIFKAVNELRLAVGENFTTADLHVSVFDSGTFYEPLCMEDAYGDGIQPSGKRTPELIVGTTGMGLKKLMAERDAYDNPMFQSLTSATIVLESTLKEALTSVQSSGRLTKKKPVKNVDGADPEGHGSSKSKTSVPCMGLLFTEMVE